MHLQLDDDLLDPDAFLKRAVEAKIEYLNKRLEDLLIAGKRPEEVERLSAARADFLEVLRSPRLHLSKPAGVAAPATTAAPPPTAVEETPPARTSFLPKGAIPQPKRYSAVAAEPAPPAARAPSPAATAAAPRPAGGAMMNFLKSVQQSTTPGTATPPAASPSPAIPAAAARPPSTPESGAKGPMLSFLEKMKQSAPGAAASGAPAADPNPAARETNVIEQLKKRAAAAGFHDVYEMLQFKRERLIESMAEFEGSPSAEKIRAMVAAEIKEIDDLMKLRPVEIVKKVKEFKEVAAVDKGGLAAIQEEISDLLDEIK